MIFSFLYQNEFKAIENRDIVFNSELKNNESMTIKLNPSDSSYIRIDPLENNPENSPKTLTMKVICPDLEINTTNILELIKEEESVGMEIIDNYYYKNGNFSFKNTLVRQVTYNISIIPDSSGPYLLLVTHNYPELSELSLNSVIFFFLFSCFITFFAILMLKTEYDDKISRSFKIIIVLNCLICLIYAFIECSFYMSIYLYK
ncbi:MAG: hypothetical protein ACTSQS_15015 [Promethearchaeota archaeon]